MWNFIQKLQNKPERARKRILLLTTSCLTLIILAFWLISFHNSTGINQAAVSSSSTASPIESLKSSISSVINNDNNLGQNATDSTQISTGTYPQ
jgi:hypothetical protein